VPAVTSSGGKLTGILVALAVVVSGCGDSDEGSQSTSPTTSTSTTSTEATTQTTKPHGPAAGTADIYFTSGEQFRTVERELPAGGDELSAAAEAVVGGPTKPERKAKVEVQTAIPAGTDVKDVNLEDDGTAVVEVTPEFTEGIPAEPAERSRSQRSELNARLGQLTYTLTQFPKVKATKVVAGGVAVEPEPTLERNDYAKPAKGPARVAHPAAARGSSVRALQTRLAELRYLPKHAIDGVEGYQTQQAVIAFQAWRGLERDGIVGPATTAALAKASVPSPGDQGPARRIEVYRDKGVTLLIAHDKVKRAIHVSTGGPGTETPSGTYSVFRKELKSWSVPFQTWLPYASYFNNGIAFHEYPDVPAYPASHGCVRVPSPEAPGVYKFAAIGTAVIVY
jgi:lipoprotein-anchoring transpeptidase ErfK/SrfK